MKVPVAIAIIITALAISLSPTPSPADDFGLTGEGLAALIHCESTTRHDINTGNGYYGAAQWIQPTWDTAASSAGFTDWIGVRPDLVPAEVQDAVTIFWWSAATPSNEWPVCYRYALDAMHASLEAPAIMFTG